MAFFFRIFKFFSSNSEIEMQKISIGRNKKAKRLKEKKKLLMVFQRTPKITSKAIVFF